MKNIIDASLEAYAARHSSPEPALYRQLVKVTRAKTKRPQMQVGHLEGSFLNLLARLSGAARILEIGTFTGYSALRMAEALPKGGTLIALDIDPHSTNIARSFWKRSRAGKKIKLKLGAALESLKKLRGPFDLVFIDADKENYIRYWNACVPKLRKGGLLIADNVLWSGRVLKPKDPMDSAIVAFNRRVRADRRVDAVMLTVRDGMTLAIKK